MTDAVRLPRRRRPGLIAGLAALYVASVVVTWLSSPDGIRTSADAESASTPFWGVLLPPAVGIALALALPPRLPAMPAAIADARRHRVTTWALLALAVLFPALCIALRLGPEGYLLAKLALLMIVPALLVALLRPAVRIERDRAPSARSWWWAPVVVIVVWTVLSQLAPWNPPFDLGGQDVAFVLVAATVTAITAGVGEELFYRRWLQTRLEAGLGPWLGLGIATLLFALMHLASHSTGDLLRDSATAIAHQGTFGLFVGIVWMRYRSLAAVIAIHLISNGWGVVAALLR